MTRFRYPPFSKGKERKGKKSPSTLYGKGTTREEVEAYFLLSDQRYPAKG